MDPEQHPMRRRAERPVLMMETQWPVIGISRSALSQLGNFEMHEFSIRLATSGDYNELGLIMFEAVRDGAPHYTERQRLAWAPEPRSGREWGDRLDSQAVFVAGSGDRLLGFMALDHDYVDLAYIRPEARGSGMFRSLYQEIEMVANQNNVKRVWTHASLTARNAFAAVGFQVKANDTTWIDDVSFDRFEMERFLI